MSWGWTLLGVFGQLLLAYLLFMLVAFSGGGLASGGSLRPRLRTRGPVLFRTTGLPSS